MDIGTISIVLLLAMLILLAIGMPLGFASAFLAVAVLVMRFEPSILWDPTTFGEGILTRQFGSGPLAILMKRIYDLMTDYVLISVPLFIFMAALLERSGIAESMYSSLNVWLSETRGGIAIVTSIMAVIMAAMSGIIGGEVVLLGLIALPQMLRLGYNQNLAIGTICASGSLGTMIPPSIVLIIFGLITETSIKALFTAAFLPGFMLASFIIIYIIVRTQLNPTLAPLPKDTEDYSGFGTNLLVKVVFGLAGVAVALWFIFGVFTWVTGGGGAGVFGLFIMAVFAAAFAFFAQRPKGQLFLAFLTLLTAGFSALLLLRVIFFQVTGQNVIEEGVDPIVFGTTEFIPWFAGALVVALGLIFAGFGTDRAAKAWDMGKGLVAPIVVIGVVLGSIYMGITGITEAAGMGVVAVFMIATILQRKGKLLTTGKLVKYGGGTVAIIAAAYGVDAATGLGWTELAVVGLGLGLVGSCLQVGAVFHMTWDALMRTLKSTGTIIWVTIGATALAGAYTIAGGPTYVANLIVGADLPTMGIILTMMVIFLFMGAFMDWVGIVLLIIPVFLPIILRLPVEEIGVFGELQAKYVAVWFGVVFCMNMQVSFLSPPFGPAAFYLKSVAPPHISLTDIFKGFLPFICIQILALSVLLIWPPIIEILLP
ncbi:MAG: TRAP transporter large permease subunit [Rhodobacter sp.]|nr:TRAP transporter large permease subunit [Rhodobacter sp.]